MRTKLDGRVALITGSGCGIGRAAALKLAAERAIGAVLEHFGSVDIVVNDA